jgi:glucose-1-phosphate thymidylyltransferase
MKAILLCAGFAARMYPLTRNFPKPLLAVAGKPVLDYLLDQIETIPEIEEVYIVSNNRFLNHFVYWLQAHEGRGTYKRFKISLLNDGADDNETRLGACGDLQLAFETIGSPEQVLVAGGDNIFRFRFNDLLKRFLGADTHMVAALPEKDLKNLQKTGVLEFGEGDHVIRLHEKPLDPPSNWVCPPLYCFQPSVWNALRQFSEEGGSSDAPGHFVAHLCSMTKVRAVRFESARLDIGSVETFLAANRVLQQEPLFIDSPEK